MRSVYAGGTSPPYPRWHVGLVGGGLTWIKARRALFVLRENALGGYNGGGYRVPPKTYCEMEG